LLPVVVVTFSGCCWLFVWLRWLLPDPVVDLPHTFVVVVVGRLRWFRTVIGCWLLPRLPVVHGLLLVTLDYVAGCWCYGCTGPTLFCWLQLLVVRLHLFYFALRCCCWLYDLLLVVCSLLRLPFICLFYIRGLFLDHFVDCGLRLRCYVCRLLVTLPFICVGLFTLLLIAVLFGLLLRWFDVVICLIYGCAQLGWWLPVARFAGPVAHVGRCGFTLVGVPHCCYTLLFRLITLLHPLITVITWLLITLLIWICDWIVTLIVPVIPWFGCDDWLRWLLLLVIWLLHDCFVIVLIDCIFTDTHVGYDVVLIWTHLFTVVIGRPFQLNLLPCCWTLPVVALLDVCVYVAIWSITRCTFGCFDCLCGCLSPLRWLADVTPLLPVARFVLPRFYVVIWLSLLPDHVDVVVTVDLRCCYGAHGVITLLLLLPYVAGLLCCWLLLYVVTLLLLIVVICPCYDSDLLRCCDYVVDWCRCYLHVGCVTLPVVTHLNVVWLLVLVLIVTRYPFTLLTNSRCWFELPWLLVICCSLPICWTLYVRCCCWLRLLNLLLPCAVTFVDCCCWLLIATFPLRYTLYPCPFPSYLCYVGPICPLYDLPSCALIGAIWSIWFPLFVLITLVTTLICCPFCVCWHGFYPFVDLDCWFITIVTRWLRWLLVTLRCCCWHCYRWRVTTLVLYYVAVVVCWLRAFVVDVVAGLPMITFALCRCCYAIYHCVVVGSRNLFDVVVVVLVCCCCCHLYVTWLPLFYIGLYVVGWLRWTLLLFYCCPLMIADLQPVVTFNLLLLPLWYVVWTLYVDLRFVDLIAVITFPTLFHDLTFGLLICWFGGDCLLHCCCVVGAVVWLVLWRCWFVVVVTLLLRCSRCCCWFTGWLRLRCWVVTLLDVAVVGDRCCCCCSVDCWPVCCSRCRCYLRWNWPRWFTPRFCCVVGWMPLVGTRCLRWLLTLVTLQLLLLVTFVGYVAITWTRLFVLLLGRCSFILSCVGYCCWMVTLRYVVDALVIWRCVTLLDCFVVVLPFVWLRYLFYPLLLWRWIDYRCCLPRYICCCDCGEFDVVCWLLLWRYFICVYADLLLLLIVGWLLCRCWFVDYVVVVVVVLVCCCVDTLLPLLLIERCCCWTDVCPLRCRCPVCCVDCWLLLLPVVVVVVLRFVVVVYDCCCCYGVICWCYCWLRCWFPLFRCWFGTLLCYVVVLIVVALIRYVALRCPALLDVVCWLISLLLFVYGDYDIRCCWRFTLRLLRCICLRCTVTLLLIVRCTFICPLLVVDLLPHVVCCCCCRLLLLLLLRCVVGFGWFVGCCTAHVVDCCCYVVVDYPYGWFDCVTVAVGLIYICVVADIYCGVVVTVCSQTLLLLPRCLLITVCFCWLIVGVVDYPLLM